MKRAAFLATGAVLALAPRAVRSQGLEKLRMSAVPTDDMTPIYWGVKSGIYQKAGIDLEIVPVSSGSASTAAVISGAYEMGKASPIASVIAHLKGLPVTVIANGAVFLKGDRWTGMLVAADSPIKTAADCNGKTGCAAGLNDINQVSIMNWVDKNGGDSKTIKWVEIPGSATELALADHRVDFAVLNEPLLSAALANGKVRLLANAFASVADRWLASAYLTQPDFAAKHPDLMRKFARATYDAAGYSNTHTTETIAVMSDASKIPMAVFSKMYRIEGATSGEAALLQALIEVITRYKIISRTLPAAEMYWSA